jgi:hypothetical protein
MRLIQIAEARDRQICRGLFVRRRTHRSVGAEVAVVQRPSHWVSASHPRGSRRRSLQSTTWPSSSWFASCYSVCSGCCGSSWAAIYSARAIYRHVRHHRLIRATRSTRHVPRASVAGRESVEGTLQCHWSGSASMRAGLISAALGGCSEGPCPCGSTGQRSSESVKCAFRSAPGSASSLATAGTTASSSGRTVPQRSSALSELTAGPSRTAAFTRRTPAARRSSPEQQDTRRNRGRR